MHRIEDFPRPKNKPHGFYTWVSQASPLIDWLFNVALGLKDGELTTYDPIRADWMLLAPGESEWVSYRALLNLMVQSALQPDGGILG